jgi:hypothetical protein
MPVIREQKTDHCLIIYYEQLTMFEPDLKYLPKAFRYATDGRSKALTQASFSSRLQWRNASARGNSQFRSKEDFPY